MNTAVAHSLRQREVAIMALIAVVPSAEPSLK